MERLKTITKSGVTYKTPKVTLLHATPLINAEVAGRTCYNSFDKSEHQLVRNFTNNGEDVGSSELMKSLCHVHHHLSVAEHINLTFRIEEVSRGVLQEHARHRISSLSVQSTRYTMQDVLFVFISAYQLEDTSTVTAEQLFLKFLRGLNILVVTNDWYEEIEAMAIYFKLKRMVEYGDNIINSMLSNEAKIVFTNFLKQTTYPVIDDVNNLYHTLKLCKHKRNVGDNFKHIVTDMWSVDLVWTVNLRSLQNYLKLRDSGGAYFLMRELAQEIKAEVPKKYLELIIKTN